MSAQPNFSTRFVRKTQLAAHEYHKNFYKMDGEIIAALTSAEADKVTPLMSKIYLRLVNAPEGYWEREGVLRFEAEIKEGKQIKAWAALCEMVGVASATANKALTWMHREGIIGYYAGKNGVGIRIFLNRAAASIGTRESERNQKILRFAPASFEGVAVSCNETAFSDPFGDQEVLDTDFNSRAPKTGAETKPDGKNPPDPVRTAPDDAQQNPPPQRREVIQPCSSPDAFSLDEIVTRLRSVLEPKLLAAATQAAQREHERTREWLDKHGIPKATRVAQREAYNVLRKSGAVAAKDERARAALEVGRASADPYAPAAPRPLTAQEIRETAETCIALLEAQGRSIELTLSEISAEGGGWLSPEDAPRVREAAQSLLNARGEGGSNDVSSR